MEPCRGGASEGLLLARLRAIAPVTIRLPQSVAEHLLFSAVQCLDGKLPSVLDRVRMDFQLLGGPIYHAKGDQGVAQVGRGMIAQAPSWA